MNCISDLLQNVHTHVFWNVGVAFCSAKLFQECSVRVRSFVVDFEFKVLKKDRLCPRLLTLQHRKTTMAKSVAVFSSGAEQKEQISGYLKFQQVGSFKTTMPQRPFNHFLARLGCGWRVNCNIS